MDAPLGRRADPQAIDAHSELVTVVARQSFAKDLAHSIEAVGAHGREMIELEYGITDRWDAALYNMLDVITAGDSTSGYAGFKIETRYRPSDRCQWPIDPVFYLEF